VQGFGAVGRHAALQLMRRGARVVAVSDISGAVQDPDGLDIEALSAFKHDRPLGEFPGAKPMERDALIGADCDILVPAAQADVIHEGNADWVRARVVLQGANLPVTAGAEAIFAQRGVLSIPDVVANAGGVICAAVELRGGTTDQAFAAIAEKIRASTGELLGRMRGRIPTLPRQAALAMARERLTAAEAYRRRF
jgi:glutamate dehydrogenase/leucine dehydrogenase